MTVIVRKYWKWNPTRAIAGIRIGDSVNEHLEHGVISKNEEGESDYSGVNGFPWSVKAEQGKVNSIFCRKDFFELIPGVWDAEVGDFTRMMNQEFEEIPADQKGCRLRAVFRGGFIAIAGIEQKN